MLISISKVRINHANSDETLCFSCDIKDGRKTIGTARNAGHGGQTEIRLSVDHAQVAAAARAWFAEHGTEEERRLVAPKDGGYSPDPVEFLIDILVERHDQEQERKKTEKVAEKNRARFAAGGLPFMVEIHTPQCITWFGLRSDAAEYVDATLAKARQKYGDVLSHTVTSTNGSAQ